MLRARPRRFGNFEGDPDKQAPADEASTELGEAIERVMARLEDEPDGSVLSWMLRYERDGDRMTRDEIVANTKLMLSGGLQEPRDLIALTVWALGSDPDQLERVREDRSLVKAAVEETLRWAGPVGTSTRQTTQATELAGVELEAGALIGAVLSSANRDPSRFTDPDRFDIGRKEGAHLAFSIGTHFCLGRGSAGISHGCRWTSCSTACPTSGSTRSGRSRCPAGSSAPRFDVGALGHRCRVVGPLSSAGTGRLRTTWSRRPCSRATGRNRSPA